MRLSELISKLQELHNKHGDLTVFTVINSYPDDYDLLSEFESPVEYFENQDVILSGHEDAKMNGVALGYYVPPEY